MTTIFVSCSAMADREHCKTFTLNGYANSIRYGFFNAQGDIPSNPHH
ncbi:hypothetical protein GNZ24_05905 [Burkholderia thailandensis]|nr:hypothetical protein [Burkholderia thailandensis]MCS6480001.1 hypothetical protein [Burkholderia thailandensis]MCS6497951.1 hypothetical protein [Burkholderia thailandensis]MUV26583.1 hypothetical protein [Burkholderia thailandensis]QRA11275.1 hypothetical protein JMY07_01310 [Burkholderia thailandensis]